MEGYKSFEDYNVWQNSRKLVNLIYESMKYCKDFSFKDQFCRASISVMNNIAEGFERRGDKEFRQFLYISKGSCGEVRSMSYIAQDLGHIDKNVFMSIFELSTLISKQLSSLISKMNN